MTCFFPCGDWCLHSSPCVMAWGAMCVGCSAVKETSSGHFRVRPHVLLLLSERPDGFWCHLYYASTTQLEFPFLAAFRTLESFSWPAPHVSCLAVYSRWAWVLLWQCFPRSSAWHRAWLDYSNLPCYRLLLLFLIVPAMKATQRGLALPTSVSL